jgi:hypothetical protein
MSDSSDFPSIDAVRNMGCGLIIRDREVRLMVSLGDEDGPLLGAEMDVEEANVVIQGLIKAVYEAEMINKAITTMGREAADEYLANWAKRFNAPSN